MWPQLFNAIIFLRRALIKFLKGSGALLQLLLDFVIAGLRSLFLFDFQLRNLADCFAILSGVGLGGSR